MSEASLPRKSYSVVISLSQVVTQGAQNRKILDGRGSCPSVTPSQTV